jgi:hypothetical protein
MPKPCPCKDCVAPKRHPGCHSACKDYIDWNAEHQQKLTKIREINRAENDCFPNRYRKRREQ